MQGSGGSEASLFQFDVAVMANRRPSKSAFIGGALMVFVADPAVVRMRAALKGVFGWTEHATSDRLAAFDPLVFGVGHQSLPFLYARVLSRFSGPVNPPYSIGQNDASMPSSKENRMR